MLGRAQQLVCPLALLSVGLRPSHSHGGSPDCFTALHSTRFSASQLAPSGSTAIARTVSCPAHASLTCHSPGGQHSVTSLPSLPEGQPVQGPLGSLHIPSTAPIPWVISI